MGKEAAQIWQKIWDEIEDRWKQRFGRDDITKLYNSLQNITKHSEVELPLGIPAGLAVAEGEQYPPRSTEIESLPLSALLFQVLLMFTIEFNQGSRVPLVLCANVIRVLGENPVRPADLPRLTGGSSEVSDIGWRLKPYVLLEYDASGRRRKVIRLSSLGLRAQQEYYRLSDSIERDWEKRFGTAEVRALRSCLEDLLVKKKGDQSVLALGLAPPPGIARSGTLVPALGRRDVGAAARQRARDVIEQNKRFLENPEQSLPHYPKWDMNRGFGP